MRIPVFIAFLALVGSEAALAQGISYGVKAGVNLADLSFDPAGPASVDPRPGPQAGIFVTLPVRGWLGVQSEAIYTVKGASVRSNDISSDLILDYLEVPLLVRVNLARRWHVVAGPALGVRLRARSRTSFRGSTEEIDLANEVERRDLGVAAGAGLEVGRWIVDARYTYGLSDVDADTEDDVKIRNRALSFSAGIRF